MSARPSVVRTYGARRRMRDAGEKAAHQLDKENRNVDVKGDAAHVGSKAMSSAYHHAPCSPPSSFLPSMTFSSSPSSAALSHSAAEPSTPSSASLPPAIKIMIGHDAASSPPSSPSRVAKRARTSPCTRNSQDAEEPAPRRLGTLHARNPETEATTPGNRLLQGKQGKAVSGTRKPLRQLHLVPSRRLPPSSASSAAAPPKDAPRISVLISSLVSPGSGSSSSHTGPAGPASARAAPLGHAPTTPASLYTTCSQCGMTYVRGGLGEEDEVLHRRHCARVRAGVVWGSGPGGVVQGDGEVVQEVRFTGDRGKSAVGRVICVPGGAAKHHRKLAQVLDMVDTVLSSPPLPDTVLAKCKIYLLVSSASPPPAPAPGFGGKRARPGAAVDLPAAEMKKDRVVACVVAQEIQWAMEVVEPGADAGEDEGVSVRGQHETDKGYVVVDPAGANGAADLGVMCHPARLPTRLGIHRLFTLPAYRGLGLAWHLLDAACAHTVYGHPCDPAAGEVAFSQPTGAGRAVMRAWGGGRVRVFVENEQEGPAHDGQEGQD